MQHGDLAVSEFLGAGVQSTAGAAGGIAAGGAVVLRGKVEVLKAVQCQIEVRNGDLLQSHGLAGLLAGLERIVVREGEVNRHRLMGSFFHLDCKGLVFRGGEGLTLPDIADLFHQIGVSAVSR